MNDASGLTQLNRWCLRLVRSRIFEVSCKRCHGNGARGKWTNNQSKPFEHVRRWQKRTPRFSIYSTRFDLPFVLSYGTLYYAAFSESWERLLLPELLHTNLIMCARSKMAAIMDFAVVIIFHSHKLCSTYPPLAGLGGMANSESFKYLYRYHMNVLTTLQKIPFDQPMYSRKRR